MKLKTKGFTGKSLELKYDKNILKIKEDEIPVSLIKNSKELLEAADEMANIFRNIEVGRYCGEDYFANASNFLEAMKLKDKVELIINKICEK